MNKTVIIAICGKAATGKDTLAEKLSSLLGAHNIVSDTTRPKRKNEKDGIDYHFLSSLSFLKKIKTGKYLEHSCFNNWYYGTDIDEIHKNSINVGVFNKEGIEALLSKDREYAYTILPVYLESNLLTRIKRYIKRDRISYELVRRILVDEKDFKDFKEKVLSKFTYRIIIENQNKNIDYIANTIVSYIKNENIVL